MPNISCVSCINSACCKNYEVEVSKAEFESYDLVLQSNFLKKSEEILKSYSGLSEERRRRFEQYIDEESGNSYAKLPKDQTGYCVLLDKKTMLCSIYDKRPKVCREFKHERCEKIRVLNNED